MRRAINVVLIASTSLAACTHNALGEGDEGAGRAPVCDPAAVEPFPEGEPIWTQQDVDTCAKACPDASKTCRRMNCPNSEAHDLCVLDTHDACVTTLEGNCRSEWEEYSCCSLSCEVDQLDDDELRQCIVDACADELAAFGACSDDGLASGDACLESAERACVLRD